jgi:hypothetical protein
MSQIYPVFHGKLLRKYFEPSAVFTKRPEVSRPPPKIDGTGAELFEVDYILDKRVRRKRTQYLVKWKGYPIQEADWVGYFEGDETWATDLKKIKAFEKSLKKPSKTRSKAGRAVRNCEPAPTLAKVKVFSVLGNAVADADESYFNVLCNWDQGKVFLRCAKFGVRKVLTSSCSSENFQDVAFVA